MFNDCLSCPVRKLTICGALGLDELSVTENHKNGNKKFPAGSSLYHEGESCNSMFIILSGWVVKRRNMENGKRMNLNYKLPGDLVGFQLDPIKPLQHTATCLTEVVVCVLPRIGFNSLLINNPVLALALNQKKSRDEERLQANLINIATRPAPSRLAFFLLNMRSRIIETFSIKNRDEIYLPLTQQDIADTLGLTNVHVSRALSTLQKKNLLTFKKYRLCIHDLAGLAEIAQTAEVSEIPSTSYTDLLDVV